METARIICAFLSLFTSLVVLGAVIYCGIVMIKTLRGK